MRRRFLEITGERHYISEVEKIFLVEKENIMGKVIRCGVCGLGRIGWGFHVPAIMNCDGMELAAVADPLQERLDEAQKTYGVPNCFTDWKALGDPVLIDLVVIASPTAFHREQCEFFLRRGIDVFCDKPMALSLDEAQSMARTAQENGRKLMIYQPHRYNGLTLKAREIIDSGKLGKIYKFRRNVYSFVRRNDWQAFSAQGGGMLNNYGAHFLDQLLYLGGEKKAEALRCETARILSAGDAEDYVSVVMRGGKGVIYELEINMAAAYPVPPDLEIFGTQGSAVFQHGKWTLKYCGELPEVKIQEGLAALDRRYPPREQNFTEESAENPEVPSFAWYNWCRDYFNGSATPLVPVEETLEIMRLLEEGRRSSNRFWQ